MKIFIKDGVARFVYDDALHQTMKKLGDVSISRASHVEPHPMSTGSGWIVDLRPMGGRIYGMTGHSTTLSPPDIDAVIGWPTRQAALDWERLWLEEHLAKVS